MFEELIDTITIEIKQEKDLDKKYALVSSLKELLQANITYEYVKPKLTKEEIEEN